MIVCTRRSQFASNVEMRLWSRSNNSNCTRSLKASGSIMLILFSFRESFFNFDIPEKVLLDSFVILFLLNFITAIFTRYDIDPGSRELMLFVEKSKVEIFPVGMSDGMFTMCLHFTELYFQSHVQSSGQSLLPAPSERARRSEKNKVVHLMVDTGKIFDIGMFLLSWGFLHMTLKRKKHNSNNIQFLDISKQEKVLLYISISRISNLLGSKFSLKGAPVG